MRLISLFLTLAFAFAQPGFVPAPRAQSRETKTLEIYYIDVEGGQVGPRGADTDQTLLRPRPDR